MVKKKEDKDVQDVQEDTTVDTKANVVDTNAGPDAISGTIANSKAEATAPFSHAGDPVDTNAGK